MGTLTREDVVRLCPGIQREHGERFNRLLAVLRRSEISLPEMEP